MDSWHRSDSRRHSHSNRLGVIITIEERIESSIAIRDKIERDRERKKYEKEEEEKESSKKRKKFRKISLEFFGDNSRRQIDDFTLSSNDMFTLLVCYITRRYVYIPAYIRLVCLILIF